MYKNNWNYNKNIKNYINIFKNNKNDKNIQQNY